MARFSTEVCTTSGNSPDSRISSPPRRASASPLALRSTSTQPVNRFLAFHSLSPCRKSTSLPTSLMKPSLQSGRSGLQNRAANQGDRTGGGGRRAPPVHVARDGDRPIAIAAGAAAARPARTGGCARANGPTPPSLPKGIAGSENDRTSPFYGLQPDQLSGVSQTRSELRCISVIVLEPGPKGRPTCPRVPAEPQGRRLLLVVEPDLVVQPPDLVAGREPPVERGRVGLLDDQQRDAGRVGRATQVVKRILSTVDGRQMVRRAVAVQRPVLAVVAGDDHHAG